MTDTLKEFYAGTLTYADLDAGYPLVTTGSSTSAVIKEVLLRSSSTTKHVLRLKAGATKIQDVQGDVVMTGPEIIGASSNLNISAVAKAVLTGLRAITSTTQIFLKTFATMFSDETGTSTSTLVSSGPAITPSLFSMPDFFCFDASGNFYYEAHTNQNLYKRSGGVNGTQTTLSAGGPKCWDGSRYIYSVSATTIYTFDTQTGVLTSVAATQNAYSATTGSLCAIDGYIFWRGSTGTTELRNASTGALVATFSLQNGGSYLYGMEVTKDQDGAYWLLSFGPTPVFVQSVGFGTNLAAPAITTTNTGTTATDVPYSSSSPWVNYVLRPVSASGVLVGLAPGGIRLYDAKTAALLATRTVTGLSNSSIPSIIYTDPTVVSAAYGTVAARVVGVEIT